MLILDTVPLVLISVKASSNAVPGLLFVSAASIYSLASSAPQISTGIKVLFQSISLGITTPCIFKPKRSRA